MTFNLNPLSWLSSHPAAPAPPSPPSPNDRLSISRGNLIEVRQIADSLLHQNGELMERLADIELSLEDAGWLKMGSQFDREFSRSGLESIIKLSRYMYLKNPIINRSVNLQADYVMAEGFSLSTADDDELNLSIESFFSDPLNRLSIGNPESQIQRERDLQIEGNMFFAAFTGRGSNLSSESKVAIRCLPVDEVKEIITNPEDASEPWLYLREYSRRALGDNSATSGELVRVAYPDIFSVEQVRSALGGADAYERYPIQWNAPIRHVKVGGLGFMRFGVPETFQSLDWARYYKEFLEDWVSVMRSLQLFAWKFHNKTGSRKVVDDIKNKLKTALTGTSRVDTNPPPVAGGVAVVGGPNGDTDMTPMNIKGANISMEDGRRLLLMAIAGQGNPETFYGDVSVGTLATAKSLDRPTELRFIARQKLWGGVYVDLVTYALANDKSKGEGGLIAKTRAGSKIQCKWPPIVQADVQQSISSVISAATLDGKPPAHTIDRDSVRKLLLAKLGVNENIDDILRKADEEMEKAAQEGKEQQRQQAQRTKEAVREARQSVQEFVAKYKDAPGIEGLIEALDVVDTL